MLKRGYFFKKIKNVDKKTLTTLFL